MLVGPAQARCCFWHVGSQCFPIPDACRRDPNLREDFYPFRRRSAAIDPIPIKIPVKALPLRGKTGGSFGDRLFCSWLSRHQTLNRALSACRRPIIAVLPPTGRIDHLGPLHGACFFDERGSKLTFAAAGTLVRCGPHAAVDAALAKVWKVRQAAGSPANEIRPLRIAAEVLPNRSERRLRALGQSSSGVMHS